MLKKLGINLSDPYVVLGSYLVDSALSIMTEAQIWH